MAAVLKGKVDAVLLTGGMAHSERVVRQLRGYLEWIAPVRVYPGEDELQALAEGVFRVLNGEEQAKSFAAHAAALLEGDLNRGSAPLPPKPSRLDGSAVNLHQQAVIGLCSEFCEKQAAAIGGHPPELFAARKAKRAGHQRIHISRWKAIACYAFFH